MPWQVQLVTSILAALSPVTGLLGIWIGQKIAKQAADSRWRLDQKLYLYQQILRSINEYSIYLADTSDNFKFSQGGPLRPSISKKNTEIAEEFHAARALTPLFLSSESLRLINSVGSVFYTHTYPFSDGKVEDLDAFHRQLREVREALVDSAKLDLGTSKF